MKLRDIADIRTGIVTARARCEKGTHSYKMLTLRSFNANGKLSKEYLDEFKSEKELVNCYLTRKGDILIRLREPNIAVFIDEESEGLLIPSFVAIVRVRDDSYEVDKKFLTYYLNSLIVKKELHRLITGTAINMIKTTELYGITIILPPLDEQKKLVKFLDLAYQEINILEKLKKEKENYCKEIFNSEVKSYDNKKNENNKIKNGVRK